MKKLRYLCEALLVYFLMFVFRILPVDMASNLGGFIGRNVSYFMPATRKAKVHIKKSLSTNENDTNRIAYDMWDNLGRLFAEYPHLREICASKTEFVGLENLGELPTTPHSPAIFFSGHIANWEISPLAVQKMNIDVDLIYRVPNNPYVKNILNTYRSHNGLLKSYPKSAQGMRQVIMALKEGRRIGILIDQKYNQGIEFPFFGQPAMTSLAFIQLAKRFNCPLIPFQVERLNGANFRITIHKAMDLSKEDTALMTEAHTLLENWIRHRPAQWIWIHKRWKPQ
jgi:Kdo2-lipid IVA lauroyltransferase/acyltransferase